MRMVFAVDGGGSLNHKNSVSLLSGLIVQSQVSPFHTHKHIKTIQCTVANSTMISTFSIYSLYRLGSIFSLPGLWSPHKTRNSIYKPSMDEKYTAIPSWVLSEDILVM